MNFPKNGDDADEAALRRLQEESRQRLNTAQGSTFWFQHCQERLNNPSMLQSPSPKKKTTDPSA